MVISISEGENLLQEIQRAELPENWHALEAYPQLQAIGSKWYLSKESLVLKVPSVLIREEYNYILNRQHPDFRTKISLWVQEDFF